MNPDDFHMNDERLALMLSSIANPAIYVASGMVALVTAPIRLNDAADEGEGGEA